MVLAALGVCLAYKWFDRWRFARELRMSRVTVDELAHMLIEGTAPVVLDVRSEANQARDGRIPGAITARIDAPLDLAGDGDVVIYCACPNEASAANLARRLRARGFTRVRPLLGGLDAWIAAGHKVER
jgi:rhodanese-related sulfurtransferase